MRAFGRDAPSKRDIFGYFPNKDPHICNLECRKGSRAANSQARAKSHGFEQLDIRTFTKNPVQKPASEMNSGQNKCAKITALIPEYRALSEFRAQKRRSDCAVLKIADFGPAQGKRGMPIERSTPTIGTTRIFCAAQFKREIPAPLLNVGGESLRGHPNARADREIQVGRGAFARGSIINMVISAHFFCPSFYVVRNHKIVLGAWLGGVVLGLFTMFAFRVQTIGF